VGGSLKLLLWTIDGELSLEQGICKIEWSVVGCGASGHFIDGQIKSGFFLTRFPFNLQSSNSFATTAMIGGCEPLVPDGVDF